MAFSASSIAKAQKRRRSRLPADPPPGTYDPAYDAQGRQAQRGYDDLLQDFARGKQRSEDDLRIQLGQLDRSAGENRFDLTESRDRNLADLLTNRTRGGEDYRNATAGLNRRYASLGRVQGERARQAHVESAGILAQSLAKRQQNRALDQQPLDLAHQRALADSTTAEKRLGADYTRGMGRTETEAGDRSDALKLAFDRLYGQGGDNIVNVARAGRDLTAGNLDLSGQKWWQAAAAGYTPPRRKRRALIV